MSAKFSNGFTQECSTQGQVDDAVKKSDTGWSNPAQLAVHMTTEGHNHERPKLKGNALEGRNIVIFGNSGVGKSSLINMLNGQRIAETSDGAIGCTFESRRYSMRIFGEMINVWDTAGLDEGTEGRVPSRIAEDNLSKLLHELRNADGIHLLVYCIRGPNVLRSLAKNYTVFYSAICRKKVPIVVVITGLENYPSKSESMDDWWIKGKRELARYKMRFDDHACVTTMDMQKAVGTAHEERSILSQQLLRELIIRHCHRVITRPLSDTALFIKTVLQDFRSMMKSGFEIVQSTSIVVFCQTDVPLFQSVSLGDSRQLVSQTSGRTFVFQEAGDLSDRYITTKVSKGGADLLIFSGSLSSANVERLQRFYVRCAGEICPLLIVTHDSTSIDTWKERLGALGMDAHVEPLFSSSADGYLGQVDFLHLVDVLCLVRGVEKARAGNVFGFLRRILKGTEVRGPYTV